MIFWWRDATCVTCSVIFRWCDATCVSYLVIFWWRNATYASYSVIFWWNDATFITYPASYFGGVMLLILYWVLTAASLVQIPYIINNEISEGGNLTYLE